jgi:hypothetical protein
MKAILTCIVIFSFSMTVGAQKSSEFNDKQEFPEIATENNHGEVLLKKRLPKKKNIARLYLFKNSRVKKELSFRTKRSKSKLA